MIYTNCEECCFCQKEKGCLVGQICHKKSDNKINTPGYCRVFRSKNWATKIGSIDTAMLYKKAIDKAEFKMDLLVLFHEDIATESNLQRTIDETWFGSYVNNIIIADTTNSQNRKNIALKYFKNSGKDKTYKNIPLLLDISTEEELPQEASKTVYRMSKKIKSPFFMVLFAGKKLSNINILANHIIHWPTRVIHWSFPTIIDIIETLITTVNPGGLYITEPYRELAINNGKPFAQQLQENQGTKIALSWLCDGCWLI